MAYRNYDWIMSGIALILSSVWAFFICAHHQGGGILMIFFSLLCACFGWKYTGPKKTTAQIISESLSIKSTKVLTTLFGYLVIFPSSSSLSLPSILSSIAVVLLTHDQQPLSSRSTHISFFGSSTRVVTTEARVSRCKSAGFDVGRLRKALWFLRFTE